MYTKCRKDPMKVRASFWKDNKIDKPLAKAYYEKERTHLNRMRNER